VAINKDRHVWIIIVRREITLHLEAGYIFAGCSRRNRFFLQFGGGPYMLRQFVELTGTLKREKGRPQLIRASRTA